MLRRSRAMAAPGMVLSQATNATMPSNIWPRATSSIESAITSRLTRDVFMPSVPMVIPSLMAMVLNSMGVPPMAFGADAVYHNAMKRWLIRLLVVVVSLFGLMLVAGLVTRSVISGSSQHGLAASLSDSLGVPVTVGAANFDLVQWFLLRP